MSGSYDAIVIGAGVIGTALGLARKGLGVLCVDRLPAAGCGSTSSSSAIIRPYYSTVDGCALGWESRFYGRDRSSSPAPDLLLSLTRSLVRKPCPRALRARSFRAGARIPRDCTFPLLSR